MSDVTSRQNISRGAEGAAKEWAANPTQPKPQNPFDAIWWPDHHKQWACDFERHLLRYTAPEGVESEGGC